MSSHVPEFVVITLIAAVVNGALGYGFSSITVPLALFFVSNRLLNPALVLSELVSNGYVLWLNRDALPNVTRRSLPIVAGLAPGIVCGTLAVALVRPDWLKLWTFSVLLPLILLQAAGFRRPIRREGRWGLAFGSGIGALYSLTTISGPPLALLLKNQGLPTREFRAALGLIRLCEATFTAAAYWYAGFFTRQALGLLPLIVPSLVVGVPTGAWLIRRVDPGTFRRICVSFDVWVSAFGVSTLLRVLHLVGGTAAYSVLGAAGAADAVLLYRFFAAPRPSAPALPVSA
jgi:uncharacterized membrane protein YfcA